jgi:hypothetical protein
MRIEPRFIPVLDTYVQSRRATETCANYDQIPAETFTLTGLRFSTQLRKTL